jgi:hypothetical protein
MRKLVFNYVRFLGTHPWVKHNHTVHQKEDGEGKEEEKKRCLISGLLMEMSTSMNDNYIFI